MVEKTECTGRSQKVRFKNKLYKKIMETQWATEANSPADRGRYTYDIERQFHFGFILSV